MTKTVSCRLSSETHGKLLDKCNNKGMTVNDFVKVLVQSALDGTPELAQDSTSNRLDSTKKSETDFQEKITEKTREVNLNADKKRLWLESLTGINHKMNRSLPLSLNYFTKEQI